MKLGFYLLLFTSVILISGCTQPATVTKLKPFDLGQPIYKIEEGKLNQELKIRTAILKAKSDIKQSEVKSSTPSNFFQSYSLLYLNNNLNTTTNNNKNVFIISNEFDYALNKSIESVLLQKGYNVVGAFENWDILTYEDKKNIDFIIIPEFNIKETADYNMEIKMPKIGPYGLVLEKGKVLYKGPAKLVGTIIINIIEPLTREKLWIKQLSVESESQDFEVEVQFEKLEQVNEAKLLAEGNFNKVRNSFFSKFSEAIYNKFIETSKKYIPAGEEAVTLSKQARQLKEIKRY